MSTAGLRPTLVSQKRNRNGGGEKGRREGGEEEEGEKGGGEEVACVWGGREGVVVVVGGCGRGGGGADSWWHPDGVVVADLGEYFQLLRSESRCQLDNDCSGLPGATGSYQKLHGRRVLPRMREVVAKAVEPVAPHTLPSSHPSKTSVAVGREEQNCLVCQESHNPQICTRAFSWIRQ